ncbi:DUF2141 domain-containing protein [Novosphingobium sp. Gsoil 351]|uniref:DUF2141 domain-containing protein n=1 Tax=Novosphingobium sp. Gsoil 351 TaxID=2675225 RepID=UPI0012B47412|nr:DUF2141 domain-containing protein [Novosphingobium sp. Gsoil 351]QGN55539.1 DUF2141 domain-containing protein [Novosphingobium sp. Gsoil 351]
MLQPRRLSAAALVLTAATAFAAPAAAAPAGCLGTPSDTWLNVSIEGLRNGEGLVNVAVYPDDPRQFLVKGGTIKNNRFNASAPVTRACVFVPKPGVYAIAVYHDQDASRKLNRSGLGLPTEGYGFSNNPATLAGLPAFRSVRLNVPKAGLTTHIRMKYP